MRGERGGKQQQEVWVCPSFWAAVGVDWEHGALQRKPCEVDSPVGLSTRGMQDGPRDATAGHRPWGLGAEKGTGQSNDPKASPRDGRPAGTCLPTRRKNPEALSHSKTMKAKPQSPKAPLSHCPGRRRPAAPKTRRHLLPQLHGDIWALVALPGDKPLCLCGQDTGSHPPHQQSRGDRSRRLSILHPTKPERRPKRFLPLSFL